MSKRNISCATASVTMKGRKIFFKDTFHTHAKNKIDSLKNYQPQILSNEAHASFCPSKTTHTQQRGTNKMKESPHPRQPQCSNCNRLISSRREITLDSIFVCDTYACLCDCTSRGVDESLHRHNTHLPVQIISCLDNVLCWCGARFTCCAREWKAFEGASSTLVSSCTNAFFFLRKPLSDLKMTQIHGSQGASVTFPLDNGASSSKNSQNAYTRVRKHVKTSEHRPGGSMESCACLPGS